MCVLVFRKKRKQEKMLVRFFLFFRFFLIFWKVFFEEEIGKNFFVFSAFFLKNLIILVRSGEGKNGSHKNKRKKIFSASRQKMNLFKVLACYSFPQSAVVFRIGDPVGIGRPVSSSYQKFL